MSGQSPLSSQQLDAFIFQRRLPGKYRTLIDDYFAPLAAWLTVKRGASGTLLVGVSGAQGTGKSTLAEFLRLALEVNSGWRVVVLSLDDFYLTKRDRVRLSKRVHPLLETRGVPGTHDLCMLSTCIEELKLLNAEREMQVPRFDKSIDDREDPEAWPVISGRVDVIILEGWCVGSTAQASDTLSTAINSLEEEQDPSVEWRHFVNAQLAGEYATLFKQLDALVFLRAPNFDAVKRWRIEQEEKLAAATGVSAAGVMNKSQVARFIQHFERITRENLASLPGIADVVVDLDDNHDCIRIRYAESPR